MLTRIDVRLRRRSGVTTGATANSTMMKRQSKTTVDMKIPCTQEAVHCIRVTQGHSTSGGVTYIRIRSCYTQRIGGAAYFQPADSPVQDIPPVNRSPWGSRV